MNVKKKPIKLLQEQQLIEQQSNPKFNLQVIDYIHSTTSYTKHFLQSTVNLKKSLSNHNTSTSRHHTTSTYVMA